LVFTEKFLGELKLLDETSGNEEGETYEKKVTINRCETG